MTCPANLRYSTDHEWVDLGSVPVRVGITAVATEALGELVFVDLPAVGSTVTAGQQCGEVESTKSVSDLVSPVSGTVETINDAAIADPALINSDPYGDGWLFSVEVTQAGPLMSAADYEAMTGDQR
jgi:glycine cleavage system H protein